MTSLTPISPISTPRSPAALGDELAHLAVDGVARRQDLVQRARRHGLADRELHEPVDRVGDVTRRQHGLLRIDHSRERRQRHADADAILGQDLLRRHLERRRARVDLLDLDRAADRPEGVPAGRQALGQLAVDEQQARLVRLDLRRARPAAMRARSSLSRWRLATRISVPVSMRSTSTLVIVFQNARVVFGSDEVLRLAVERDDGDLVRAGLRTISKCSSATVGCVFASSSALSAAISARTTLTTSAVRRRRKSNARSGPGRADVEPAIARQERPLVVLDDDRELEQHNTFSNLRCHFSVSGTTCSAGRRLQSHTEATGQRLSPRHQAFAPGCVRADQKIRHAGAGPWGLEPRAVSALAQSASTLAHPTAISAGASMSVGEAGKQPASRLLGSLNRRVFVANEH